MKSVTTLAAMLRKAEAERDAARIWHEKAHAFLEERNGWEKRALAAEALLEAAGLTLSHARVFIGTREKMHPDGQALYDEDLAKIVAHLGGLR